MCDLLIIGGGPAGYLAAERAGQAGMSVTLFEKRNMGGVCLNEGCIPSKTYLHSAKLFDNARHSERFGVTTTGAALDHGKVLARKNKVVRKLVLGVGAKLKQYNVQLVQQQAKAVGRRQEGFVVAAANGEEYAAPRLLLAAGSAAVVPQIPGVARGLESGFVLTNREIFELQQLPESLVVVGGGIVGLELASYFHSAGSKVTVVELLDHIAGAIEQEIAEALLAGSRKKGIEFHLGCRVVSVEEGLVRCEDKAGTIFEISAQKLLLSVGRRPALDDLGLDALGVQTENGAVATGPQMQTNVAGVYAAGDINGKSMLAHTAYREAEVAVNHMLGREDALDYSAIPSVVYTSPEIACVGETEQTAAAKGIEYKVTKLPMSYAGRYVAETEMGDGFCKLLVETAGNTLIGAHLYGSYASEIIYGAGVMIEKKTPLDELKKQVFPHPTVSEIIREALFTL